MEEKYDLYHSILNIISYLTVLASFAVHEENHACERKMQKYDTFSVSTTDPCVKRSMKMSIYTNIVQLFHCLTQAETSLKNSTDR
jgi:hypothetical protein